MSSTPSEIYSLQLADSMYLNKEYQRVVMQQIINAPLKGHSYRYSCLNFMLLKEVVERISKVPMDVYLDSVFFKPMGLKRTAYNPLKRFPKEELPLVRRLISCVAVRCRAMFMMRLLHLWEVYRVMQDLFSTTHDLAVSFPDVA